MKRNEQPSFIRLRELESHDSITMLQAAGHIGGHCPMHSVLSGLRQVDDVASIVVGTSECTNYSRFVLKDYGKHGMYSLDEDEVVFGCRDGLMEALQFMEEQGHQYVLLIMTCIPSLTGEDMEALIHEWHQSHSMTVGYVDVAHFKYKGFAVGKRLLDKQLEQWELTSRDSHSPLKPKPGADKTQEQSRVLTAIYAPHENSLALAEALATYGCEIQFIHMEHYDDADRQDKDRLLEKANPYIGYVNHEEAFIHWCYQQGIELIVSYFSKEQFANSDMAILNYLDWRTLSDREREDHIQRSIETIRKERKQ